MRYGGGGPSEKQKVIHRVTKRSAADLISVAGHSL